MSSIVGPFISFTLGVAFARLYYTDASHGAVLATLAGTILIGSVLLLAAVGVSALVKGHAHER